ncbi:O-antigen ligase family protein [Psychroserpens sp. Hel_I_66]|uniref:O-antigen ligase family protein n=1 Tax=Psychroserpens sp. Hel_I_66 TaxID=1250004 RepID=UPI000646F4C7|nr:O-antigen ligase family protein [Psychroserpens sp. Hel_I_66]
MKIKLDFIQKTVLAGLLIAPPLIFSIEVNIILISLVSFFVFANISSLYTKALINLIAPLVVIFLIAIFSSIFFSSKIFDIIKDLFFLAKPVLYIIVGYYLVSKIKSKDYLFRVIIYSGVFFAIIHLCLTIYFLMGHDFNVNRVRDFAGRGNALEVFALIILLSKKGKILFHFKSKYKKLIITLLIVSFIFYFSRTITVSFIILFLAINGYLAITRKGLFYMFGFFISVILFYAYLFSTDLERGADGIEGFLYKIKIAPAEIFSSEIDVEDHRDLWDHWRAYEAKKAFEQLEDTPWSLGILHGKGVGSLVDLEFLAPLDRDGIRYITTLHNGYAYIAFKAGVLGLASFLVFLLMLYFQVYKKEKNNKARIINNLLSGIAIYYLFITLIVSGVYNPRDFGGLIIGGLLYLNYYYTSNNTLKDA